MFDDELKVIHLFAPGPLGGAEKVIISGLKALVSSHKNLELWLIKELRVPEFCGDFIKHLDSSNIKIKVFDTKKPLDLSLIKNLKQSFNDSKVSIIHAHGIKASFYGHLSKPAASKFILTHHGNTSHTLKVKIYEYIEQRIMRKADCTITVSETMLKSLNLKRIPNTELVENMLSFNPATRTIPQNEKLELVIIGRVSPEKGHIDLLMALADIKIKYNLTIIGTGSEVELIKDYILKYNLKDKVHLIGFRSDIRPYLLSADVLLMPSHREGLPMILIEAICSGVPVIGSSVGALKYLISENGILFTPKNTDEIKASILEFNKNKKNYLDNGLKDSLKFQERFHPNRWVARTLNIYNKVFSHE